MPKIRLIQYDGTEHVVEGAVGSSVMQTAVDNMVPGILGECGGNCSCATCHGYVDPAWLDKLPPKSEDEASILEGVLHIEANSRLTCQLKLTPALDGLVIRLPESQVI
jgi:2Fe-2S ferredoxin